MALQTCCGCFSLKRGSLTIGILNLFGCFALLIMAGLLPAMMDLIITQSELKNKTLATTILSIATGCSAGLITYFIFLTILTIIFIIGVVKVKPRFILPFLWIGFTNTLMIIPFCIAIMVTASTSPEETSGKVWGYFVQYLFSSMFNVYFLMVVYYHYREIESRQNLGMAYPPCEP